MAESEIQCPACRTPLTTESFICPGCGRNVASLLPTESPTPATSIAQTEQRRIGDFRILRNIGRGGMGTVYEAYQESMRRRVALKLLDAGFLPSSDQVTRFEREAWIGGRLSHSNIVKVYAQGTEGPVHYIAMELVEGHSLAGEIDAARKRREVQQLSDSTWRAQHVSKIVSLFVGVADALEHVHQNGIVHRDGKPGNLLLTTDGERLLLSDFGLARDEAASRMTRRGDFFGTVRYMSPEQLLAHRAKVDHRTDIWSLGTALYEALTLELPYSADSEEAYIGALSTKEPAPARARNRAVPRDLETVLIKCLERDPDRRYTSAAELRQDLQRYLDDRPVLARRPGPAQKLGRLFRRHRTLMTGVVLTAVLTVAALGTLTSTLSRHRDLERIEWTLEQTLKTGKEPDNIEPGWEDLKATLQGEIQRDPHGTLALLAQRAAIHVTAEMPSFGLRSDPGQIDVTLGTAFDLGPNYFSGAPLAGVEIEGSWNNGPWIHLVSGSVASHGVTVGCSRSLSDVLPQGQLAVGPHQLDLRATLRLLDPDTVYPVKGATCSMNPIEEWWPAGSDARAASTESRSLGSFSISLFEEYPDDFPRRLPISDAS